ncbi:AMP-binding enzyme [Streptomyces sp. NBC_00988]|uniref:AMP-binding enzyme n=1 Tax=Streptomyces sp. NBC_00988 TaxID=2903704 RepID=UPI0038670B18
MVAAREHAHLLGGRGRGDGTVQVVAPRQAALGDRCSTACGSEEGKASRGGWLHTGDLGRLDHDGYLYFCGRAKDGIRRRGENISAYEVEQIIESHPCVLEAAAFGVPGELTEEDLKVCVVLRPGTQLSPEELIAYSAQRSAAYMVPRFVEFLPELPKNPTQKVEKFRLKEAGVTPATWDREAAA